LALDKLLETLTGGMEFAHAFAIGFAKQAML
jgi:hypothetical protein